MDRGRPNSQASAASAPSTPRRRLIAALGDATGGRVRMGDDLRPADLHDWTGAWPSSPLCVAAPSRASEVADVVAACSAAGVGVVPRGGNTGLVGGSVAGPDDVLVDMTALSWIAEPVGGVVRVGAGTTIGDLGRSLAGSGWRYPVDFAARDSATVGGTVATNAGGVHVFRFGSTRAQLRGIEFVRGDGAVVASGRGLGKDNTGPELAAVVCGSEGAFGLVTEATLRLLPAADRRCVSVVGFESIGAAVAAASSFAAVAAVEAVELVDDATFALMCSELGAPDPTLVGATVAVVESTGGTEALAPAMADVDCIAAIVSDGSRADALWRYRDDITVTLARRGPVAKFDVTVPTIAWPDAIDAMRRDIDSVDPGARLWVFGHVVDGNIHLNVTGHSQDLAAIVYRRVVDLGGSISAEHGIGRMKAPFLAMQRSAQDLDTIERLRDAFDPAGILNRGVWRT